MNKSALGPPPIKQQAALVDQYGRPQSYFLYPSPRSNPKAYKPRPWLSADTRVNVSAGDRYELVNYSRLAFARNTVLSSAINQKNNWAFGDAWDAHYLGANRSWGDEAENFINNQWFPNCNVRGPQYGFKRSLLLSGISWDVDGDDLMVLTSSANGFPQLAFYPATKISSYGRLNAVSLGVPKDVVAGGPYDGAKIFDGIIYDRNARPLAVRVIGDDGNPVDISVFNCDLAYEPQWSDQGRGFPRISTSLLHWMDLEDIDDFIRRGVKLASSISIIEKNEEGEAPAGNEVVTGEDNPDPDRNMYDGGAVSDRKIAYEEIDGGEIRYLSSTSKESIESLTFKNPHPNVEAFHQRVTRGCLASVGWYHELLDLSATGRAPARILCDLANQSIWSRQRTGYRRWKRAVGYAIAVGMKNGYLSRNDDGHDAYMWEPGLPKPISVDAGNEATADREAFKMGLTNRSIIAQKMHGVHYRTIDAQRAVELRETIETAIQLNKDFPQVSFDRCLELLEQRSPNPMVANQIKQPVQPKT